MRGKLLFACMSFGLSLSAVQPVAAQAANLPSLAGSLAAYFDGSQSACFRPALVSRPCDIYIRWQRGRN